MTWDDNARLCWLRIISRYPLLYRSDVVTFVYYFAHSRAAKYCDELVVCLSVCMSVCLSVYGSIRQRISANTYPNFTKLAVNIAWPSLSFFFWRRQHTLCTPGFVDDVTSYHNRPYMALCEKYMSYVSWNRFSRNITLHARRYWDGRGMMCTIALLVQLCVPSSVRTTVGVWHQTDVCVVVDSLHLSASVRDARST